MQKVPFIMKRASVGVSGCNICAGNGKTRLKEEKENEGNIERSD